MLITMFSRVFLCGLEDIFFDIHLYFPAIFIIYVDACKELHLSGFSAIGFYLIHLNSKY